MPTKKRGVSSKAVANLKAKSKAATKASKSFNNKATSSFGTIRQLEAAHLGATIDPSGAGYYGAKAQGYRQQIFDTKIKNRNLKHKAEDAKTALDTRVRAAKPMGPTGRNKKR